MAEILLEAVEEVFGKVSEAVRGRCWNGRKRQGSVLEFTPQKRADRVGPHSKVRVSRRLRIGRFPGGRLGLPGLHPILFLEGFRGCIRWLRGRG